MWAGINNTCSRRWNSWSLETWVRHSCCDSVLLGLQGHLAGWDLVSYSDVSSRHCLTEILDAFSRRVIHSHPAQRNHLHSLGSCWKPALETCNRQSCLLALGVCLYLSTVWGAQIPQGSDPHSLTYMNGSLPCLVWASQQWESEGCKHCPLFKLNWCHSEAKNSAVTEQTKVDPGSKAGIRVFNSLVTISKTVLAIKMLIQWLKE